MGHNSPIHARVLCEQHSRRAAHQIKQLVDGQLTKLSSWMMDDGAAPHCTVRSGSSLTLQRGSLTLQRVGAAAQGAASHCEGAASHCKEWERPHREQPHTARSACCIKARPSHLVCLTPANTLNFMEQTRSSRDGCASPPQTLEPLWNGHAAVAMDVLLSATCGSQMHASATKAICATPLRLMPCTYVHACTSAHTLTHTHTDTHTTRHKHGHAHTPPPLFTHTLTHNTHEKLKHAHTHRTHRCAGCVRARGAPDPSGWPGCGRGPGAHHRRRPACAVLSLPARAAASRAAAACAPGRGRAAGAQLPGQGKSTGR